MVLPGDGAPVWYGLVWYDGMVWYVPGDGAPGPLQHGPRLPAAAPRQDVGLQLVLQPRLGQTHAVDVQVARRHRCHRQVSPRR